MDIVGLSWNDDHLGLGRIIWSTITLSDIPSCITHEVMAFVRSLETSIYKYQSFHSALR